MNTRALDEEAGTSLFVVDFFGLAQDEHCLQVVEIASDELFA